ncbi:MAG TPA: D-hexose-6-phosphate mutarotase [Saprospiraceae bacterium]|nr:D-hexose-6-phosphate mutarotase [Saprospiraceae bacterium]
MGYSISNLRSGQQLLHVENQFSNATISIYGGQILSWIPKKSNEVLFLSEKALFDSKSAIRGGVPICWPWFGNKEGCEAHGFARNQLWSLTNILEDGNFTDVQLTLNHSDHKYEGVFLTLKFRISESLEISLITLNNSSETLIFTQALHTYLYVSEITNVEIEGLSNVEFYNKLTDTFNVCSTEKLKIEGEIDQIFRTRGKQILIDNYRKILIETKGSTDTVIWNPWINKSKSMKDLHEDDYLRFLCIEAANILEPIKLPCYEKFELSQKITIDQI